MPLRINDISLHVLNMHTRLPFKYGIASLTRVPHLFFRAHLEVDGIPSIGISADHLPPKWFTKNPATTFRHDVAEMVDVIQSARRLAIGLEADSPFELWSTLYSWQKVWGSEKGYPPLLWNFGVTLVERAVIEAFCKARHLTFSQALRTNALGIDLDALYREHADRPVPRLDLRQGLPPEPLKRIIARHTVGLSDPLAESDIPAAQALNDDLPQSLEASIRAYGLRHFKIKLSGDIQADAARLRRLSHLIAELAPPDFAFTLDGNENFKALVPFRELWEGLVADPTLTAFLSRLIFIEQPFHRDIALSSDIAQAMLDWPDRPPMIIDESDDQITTLLTALDCGYVGTSHKNCKGIFKSMANRCLLQALGHEIPGQLILSGEDLSNVGPVALLQDLAVAANLGIASVERNGHHYFRGASMLPQSIQHQLLQHHGDLYVLNPGGFAAVRISAGHLNTASLLDAPLGVGFELDPGQFTPLEEWRFESLGLE